MIIYITPRKEKDRNLQSIKFIQADALGFAGKMKQLNL